LLQQAELVLFNDIIAGVDRGFVPEQKLFPLTTAMNFLEKADVFMVHGPTG
jgi:hypothetical protein